MNSETILDNNRGDTMKLRIFLIVAAAMLVLAACGTKTIDESVTLLDEENNEVNFPQEKPVLLFFMTTYT
jgi:hypothetical protein